MCIQVEIALDPEPLEMLRRLSERIKCGGDGSSVCQSKERNQFGAFYRVRSSGVDGRLPFGSLSMSDRTINRLPSVLEDISPVPCLWP